MHQAPFKNDPVVNAIIDELTKIYHCHTVVLYGSRARGDFTETSDYDIAGITGKSIPKQWIARYDEINHVYHDIFIYPESELFEPNESHLQMSDGVVLIEQNGFGTHLLNQLNTLVEAPIPSDTHEREGRTIWYKKMLSRAEANDLEGKYRQIWMIHTLLEDYFFFRNMRFLGPKKAFQYLELNDKTILILFENVLNDPTNVSKLRTLIIAITEIKL